VRPRMKIGTKKRFSSCSQQKVKENKKGKSARKARQKSMVNESGPRGGEVRRSVGEERKTREFAERPAEKRENKKKGTVTPRESIH